MIDDKGGTDDPSGKEPAGAPAGLADPAGVAPAETPGPTTQVAAADDQAATSQEPASEEREITWLDWLNPAVVRGTLLIIVGIVLLSTPNLSAQILRLVIGGALVINGAVTLWHHYRHTRSRRARTFGRVEAATITVLGVFLLVFPIATVDLVAVAIGVLLGVRGMLAVIAGVQRQQPQPLVDISRGVGMLVLAAFAIGSPDSLIRSSTCCWGPWPSALVGCSSPGESGRRRTGCPATLTSPASPGLWPSGWTPGTSAASGAQRSVTVCTSSSRTRRPS